MRILVCGGRDYTDKAAVTAALDELARFNGPLTIIQGGARGADQFARDWALRRPDAELINEPANWKRDALAAGPIRNQLMLDAHLPDLVLAFPGGPGTRDMVRRARKAGVAVHKAGATPAEAT